MPSLNTYKKLLSGTSNGVVHKNESDLVMEMTWENDIATRDMYFYDWYHDDYKDRLMDLHPENDPKKIKMRCKYLAYSSQTLEKDATSFHLQMRPSQNCVVPYYEEMFEKRYSAIYPIGLYVDIEDSRGKWNKWMVVAGANINDAQFPTFELLQCNYVLQYIFKGIKYTISSILRSQNS